MPEGSSAPDEGKRKNARSSHGNDTEVDEAFYKPYIKPGYKRNFPENGSDAEYMVFVQSAREEKVGNKNPLFMATLFRNEVKGTKNIKRINANKIGVIFSQAINANDFLKNEQWLMKNDLKAFIPASAIETVGVIRFVPTSILNEEIFNKLSSRCEVIAVRRFTKRENGQIKPFGSTMFSPRQKILWFAVSTRVTIILLQAVSNFFIPDHEANVFISPSDPSLHISYADKALNTFLGGFKRWDGQYFIHIAQYGYTHENCLAFFPFFPLIVRYIAYLLNSILGSLLNFHSLLLISSTLVNFLMFIKSTDILHRLSLRVLKSESKAYKATVLYCVNPASIFFSAPYSETLFAWMSFYTMLKCTDVETLRFANINIFSSLPAGFSMITRSNGVVNLGFILYASFKNVIERTIPEIVYKYKTTKRKIIIPFLLLPLFTSCMSLLLTVIIAIIPFLLVQTYNYLKYCVPNDHNLPDFLINYEYVLPGSAASPWCNSTLPYSYSYIQSHYWDVGFLKYYKLKQIPNFVLASPIFFLITYHCCLYIVNNIKLFFRLGLKNNILNVRYSSKMPYRPRQYSKAFGANDPALFVYVVHVMSLAIFCAMFVHIQVSTRLLASASPVLYWICSSKMNVGPTPTADQNTINEHFRRIGIGKRIPSHHLSIANLEGVDNMYSRWKTFIISRRMPDFGSRLIQYYFLVYFVLGTVLFSNFYPWT